MRSFFTSILRAFAWVAPVAWVFALLGSFALNRQLTDAESVRLLTWTVVAAGVVAMYAAGRWPIMQAAFVMLCVGVLRLIFVFNIWSLVGIAIAFVAAGWMTFEHRRRLSYSAQGPYSPAQSVGQNFTAAPQRGPAGSPSNAPAQQPEAPRYDFSDKFMMPRHNFSDVLGMAETKERMLNAAYEIVNSEDGSKPRNGVLLTGDPGNGKTFLAEALAGELQTKFFSLTFNDIETKWIGEPIQKITEVFKQVVRNAPCVFFIDEIDSFLKERGASNGTAQDDRLVNTLLTELVKLRSHRVVLLAASNHLDKLDSAGVREGRFDFKIEVPAPDFEARKGILRLGIVKALGPQAVDATVIESLAQRWEGFSVVRLSSVCLELKDMRRDGEFAAGAVSFKMAMKAMRRIQGRSGKLPPDAKSVAEIIMPPQSREKLNDIAFKLKNVYELEKMGGRLPPGFVFLGPPGTGKTEGSMALAKDSEAAFFSVNGADLLADFGLWDKVVRDASNCRPAIVLIDEADRVLGDRRMSNCAALTDKIMETLSGSKGRMHDVIFIAATNHFDRFDPAVVRGGRFEEKVFFDVPDATQMRDYVGTKLGKLSGGRYGAHDDVTERAAVVLTGQSIANANAVLQKVIDLAALRVLRDGKAELRLSDVDEAAESVFADFSASE